MSLYDRISDLPVRVDSVEFETQECGIARFGTGLLLPNLNTWLAAAVPESVRGRALGGLTSAYFFEQFLSPVVTRPIADVVGLATTFRWIGVAMAGGALAFGLAAVVASPPAETEADEQLAD